MMDKQIFYIYLDKTLTGRVFYVGKGKKTRLRSKQRNKRWHNIVGKHGYTREVILGTLDEEYAFEIEIMLIKEYKTFETVWPRGEGYGSNFTTGGDGMSGKKHATGKYTFKELSIMYGTTTSNINEIIQGKTWKHLLNTIKEVK